MAQLTAIQQFQQDVRNAIRRDIVSGSYNPEQASAVLTFWGLSLDPTVQPTRNPRATRALTGFAFNPIKPIPPASTPHFPAINPNRQRFNYMVIIGPPGTGKTAVIVSGSLLAIAEPQYHRTDYHYVYVCAGTNPAADRVLESFDRFFLKKGINNANNYVKRYVGKVKHRSPLNYPIQLRPYVANNTASPSQITDSQIFIGTEWQLQSLTNTFGTYPELIMYDETSQLTPPLVYVPMTHTHFNNSRLRGVCLIGDDLQLPPITTFTQMSINSLQFIMQYSNFSVQTIPPSRVVPLKMQYRMHPAIRKIAEIFTPGRNLIDHQSVIDPNHLLQNFNPGLYPQGLTQNTRILMDQILEPQKTVVLLNTSQFDTEGSNIRVGTSRLNENEIAIVKGLVNCIKTAFPKYNYDDPEILKLMSPYKAQKENLSLIHKFSGTVDAFQGQEASIVVISLAFNENTQSSHLIDDQRLHVMMSRAKSKLIIIGLKDILVHRGRFGQVFNFIYNQNPQLTYDPILKRDITQAAFNELSML